MKTGLLLIGCLTLFVVGLSGCSTGGDATPYARYNARADTLIGAGRAGEARRLLSRALAEHPPGKKLSWEDSSALASIYGKLFYLANLDTALTRPRRPSHYCRQFYRYAASWERSDVHRLWLVRLLYWCGSEMNDLAYTVEHRRAGLVMLLEARHRCQRSGPCRLLAEIDSCLAERAPQRIARPEGLYAGKDNSPLLGTALALLAALSVTLWLRLLVVSAVVDEMRRR